MPILNPISGAALSGVDAETSGERLLQTVLALWLRTYFSGAAFQTRAVGGATVSRTFHRLELLWQEAEMPKNPQGPLLHLVLTPVDTEAARSAAAVVTRETRWLADMTVLVPVNLTGTPYAGRNPEWLAREAAGQVCWLFGSSEREALSPHGVHGVAILSEPRIMPAAIWHSRVMTAGMTQFRRQAV